MNADDADYAAAARRELAEELGLKAARKDLQEIGRFYIERPGGGGVMRRFQRVYAYMVPDPDAQFTLESAAVAQVAWFPVCQVATWLDERPADFTSSFRLALRFLVDNLD